jgi:hypothetical protein
MRQLLSAVALFLALASSALGDDKDSQNQKGRKAPLPRASTVRWDVTVLEDSPTYEVVKREVKGNTVTWVLENKRALGTEITFGYQAALYDEDGVKLATIGIEVDPFLMNMSRGERNRFNLHMPQPEKWKNIRKVVIKNGPLGD